MTDEKQAIVDEMVRTLLQAKKIADENMQSAGRIESDLRKEFELNLRHNPKIAALTAAEKEWASVLQDTITDIFPKGTIVAKPFSGSMQWYVVEDVSNARNLKLSAWRVTSRPSKAKWADEIYLNHECRIVSLEDIADKSLRTVAANIIARIRLKDL